MSSFDPRNGNAPNNGIPYALAADIVNQQNAINSLKAENAALKQSLKISEDYGKYIRAWAQQAADGRTDHLNHANELKFDLHWGDRIAGAFLDALIKCTGSKEKAQLILCAEMRASILLSRRYPAQGVAPAVSHSIAFIFKKDGVIQNAEERFNELEAECKATSADWTLKGSALVDDFINTIVLDFEMDHVVSSDDEAMTEE